MFVPAFSLSDKLLTPKVTSGAFAPSSLPMWLTAGVPNVKGREGSILFSPASVTEGWGADAPNLNVVGSLSELFSCLESEISDVLSLSTALEPNVKVAVEIDWPVLCELPTPNLIDAGELKSLRDELLTPKVKGNDAEDCPLENVGPPKVILAAGFTPGFGVSQATHEESSPLLLNMQVSQVQDPAGGANFVAKLLSGTSLEEMPNDGAAVVFVELTTPEFGDWQATHAVSVDLF